MDKRRIIILITCLISLFSQAQELIIKGMKVTNDLSASQFRRIDFAGEPCALVKVLLAAKEVGFEGNVILPVEYKGGEYWVYMTKGSRELRIKHLAASPAFVPCHVFFTDYGISSVESLATYELTLLMGREMQNLSFQDETNQIPSVIRHMINNMVRVEGATFTMGASSEQGKEAGGFEKPAHQVTLSSFFIGKYEVTQEEWRALMDSNPSKFKGANRPVENVDWNECLEFIQKLNALTGIQFRLPTEAEWEFAARGGNKSIGYKYSGSDDLGSVAWYKGNSRKQTHEVGQKLPNELGLYDMNGNVEEWCQDWLRYTDSSQTNPIGVSEERIRAIRGGSWNSEAKWCRVSSRIWHQPIGRSDSLGLRLAL